MHWATQYIGTPWLIGGSTLKEGLDCWGFFRHIQEKHYNLKLPVIQFDDYDHKAVIENFASSDERKKWLEVDSPVDGDAVLLRTSRLPNHVGVWLDCDDVVGVLHSVENMGVMFSTIKSLSTHGWKVVAFYRRRHD